MNTTQAPRIDTVPWISERPHEIAEVALEAISEFGIVRVSGFPTEVREYLGFLGIFGEPIGYYGDDAGTHPEDSAIWRIKYDPVAAASCETHAIAGPLTPHSSQSLRDPRPRFFSMLMVNAGWQTRPFGQNGESVLAPWRSAFANLQVMLGEDFEKVREVLFGNVEFPDKCFRQLAYRLPGSASDYDVGVRLKSNHLEYLQDHYPGHPVTAAVEALATAAERTALRVPLHTGDLILLDNDRWGHGRESVAGHEDGAEGEIRLNPRELWSVTIK